MMKTTVAVLATFCVLHRCAYADYYRATGGGVYELRVSDCSASGMRRALDNAVADKKAVITKVVCDTITGQDEIQTANYVEIDMLDLDSLPVVELCPCRAVQAYICGC